jgi:hypothetical protein
VKLAVGGVIEMKFSSVSKFHCVGLFSFIIEKAGPQMLSASKETSKKMLPFTTDSDI